MQYKNRGTATKKETTTINQTFAFYGFTPKILTENLRQMMEEKMNMNIVGFIIEKKQYHFKNRRVVIHVVWGINRVPHII
jgi:hypothetical protein